MGPSVGLVAILQIVNQLLPALIALVRHFRQRLHDEFAQRRANFAIHLIRRRRGRFCDLPAQLIGAISGEWFHLGDHLIENCPEAEQIGAAIQRLSAHLLRRRVVQNFRRAPRNLERERSHGRNAEIQNLYRTVPTDHDFGRLQTPVHRVVHAGVIQALACLACNVLQIPNGKSFSSSQHGSHAVTLHVLHPRAELTINFCCAIGLGNVRAIERLCAFDLFQNALHQAGGLLSEWL